jgi:hypothetical protein
MASRINRILWWSLVVSLLIYVVVAYVASVPADTQAPVTALFVAFGIASVGIGIGSLSYRRHALSGPIQRRELDPASSEGRAKAFLPFILNLALSESVGIFGLVLALVSGQGSYSIPFVLAALALTYAHRPTAPDLVPPLSGRDLGVRPPPIG